LCWRRRGNFYNHGLVGATGCKNGKRKQQQTYLCEAECCSM
jgi:hypothetical protein